MVVPQWSQWRWISYGLAERHERCKVSGILLNFEKLQFTLDDYCNEAVRTFPSRGSDTDLTSAFIVCSENGEPILSWLQVWVVCSSLVVWSPRWFQQSDRKWRSSELGRNTQRSKKLWDACHCSFLCMIKSRVKMQLARLRRPNLGKLFKKAETTFKMVGRLRHCDIARFCYV